MEKEVVRNEKLYRLRKKRGETQSEVAKSVGVSASAYCMYEAGQRTPHADTMKRIADHFDRTVQFLFFS